MKFAGNAQPAGGENEERTKKTPDSLRPVCTRLVNVGEIEWIILCGIFSTLESPPNTPFDVFFRVCRWMVARDLCLFNWNFCHFSTETGSRKRTHATPNESTTSVVKCERFQSSDGKMEGTSYNQQWNADFLLLFPTFSLNFCEFYAHVNHDAVKFPS